MIVSFNLNRTYELLLLNGLIVEPICRIRLTSTSTSKKEPIYVKGYLTFSSTQIIQHNMIVVKYVASISSSEKNARICYKLKIQNGMFSIK